MAYPEVNFPGSCNNATANGENPQDAKVKMYLQAQNYLRDLRDFNQMLDLAHSIGTPEAAQVLLEVNAMPVGRDDTSSLLLARAVHYYVGGCLSLYEVLGPRAREHGLCSLLHLAVTQGYTSIVRLLLEWGVDPNDSNELRRSPLHTAAARGDRCVAFWLLESGADPRAIHISGKTALHFSCEGSDDDWLVGRLLDLGLGVNEADRLQRNTPLHLAAKNGRWRVASLLVERGADLTARNTEGYAPAHLAAQNARMLKVLLKQDTALKCTDARGRTPLQLTDLRMTDAGRIMIKSLVKGEAITGIPMDKTNDEYIRRQPIWQDIRDECLLDIERMRKIKCYPGITCFKLLSMNVKELAKRVKGRAHLLQILKPLFLEGRKFNYTDDLKSKIEKVFEARSHAHRVAHFVNRALGDCLPREVTAKIGEFLQPQDIRFS